MNQEIDNLDEGGNANAVAAHPQPNLAAQRNQDLEVVVIDDDRLQQRMAFLAEVRNFRRIEVIEG